jgi:putative ABC transport system permease protein
MEAHPTTKPPLEMMRSLPSWIERLLKFISPVEFYEQIEGDLIELYNHEINTLGRRKAQVSLLVKAIRFIRPGIIFRRRRTQVGASNFTPMIFHNIKSSFRSMRRDKLFTGINIAGLALGITASILILAWVQYEYSYNHFIRNYKDIYQVKVNFTYDGTVNTENGNPLPLYFALRQGDSRIKDVCFTSNCFGHTLSVKDKKAYKEVLAVSDEFLEMFDIPLVRGDYNSLDDPYSIMLSESSAKEFFGDSDPIGQYITYDNAAELKVTGIYKDLPYNSDFWFMALVPTSYDKKWMTEDKDKWDAFYPQIYIRLQDNSLAGEVSTSIKEAIKPHFDDGSHPQPFLHELDRWHLYDHFEDGQEAGGKIEYVQLFTWIATLILLIACINYINLSTARSEKRAREVGIRKAIGSRRGQLIQQFMTESALSTLMALFIAIVAVGLALPWYNSLVHARLTMNIDTPNFWFIALGVFALTTLAAGFYPAFFFSSRKPIDVLRGSSNAGGRGGLPRKILVTFQFSIAIFLAIGVMVVYEQIQHARKRNLGYDLENLVAVASNDQISKSYNAIKDELLKTGVVEAVTRSNEGIDADYFTDYVEWPGKQTTDKVQFSRVLADHDFVKTVGMRVVAGRDFSPFLKSDTSSVLINETAAKIIGYTDPIGEKIKTASGYKTIIGITRDVVRGSPFDQVQPSYIGTMGDFTHSLTIRLMKTNNLPMVMEKVNGVFRRLDPLNPVASWFVDENINYSYRNINFVGELAAIFAGLAIFLTCLGVVGMAAYTAEQKKKEIAIRKILGATIASVLIYLSNYFVRIAILSVVVSSPIAWLALDNYLQEFYYRIDVPWWVIPASGFSLLAITLLIVLVQTFRAARANPVVGLRTE